MVSSLHLSSISNAYMYAKQQGLPMLCFIPLLYHVWPSFRFPFFKHHQKYLNFSLMYGQVT